jgi:hypothetical protein
LDWRVRDHQLYGSAARRSPGRCRARIARRPTFRICYPSLAARGGERDRCDCSERCWSSYAGVRRRSGQRARILSVLGILRCATRSLSPKLRRLDRRHRLAGAPGFSARMLRQMRYAVQALHGAQHASLPPLVALTPGTAAPSLRANARRAMLAARAAVYTLRGCSFAQITTV